MKVARPVRRAGRRNPPAARLTRALRLDPYIIGASNRSAIATLVERTTRFTMLIRLGRHRSAERLRDEMVAVFNALPIELRRSLTWDQGIEMACHHEFAAATGMEVYFCQPASPWQRPTNENTNGLLREYFPKGSDLSIHTADDLRAVARQLNERPRKTLGWHTPHARLDTLLRDTRDALTP